MVINEAGGARGLRVPRTQLTSRRLGDEEAGEKRLGTHVLSSAMDSAQGGGGLSLLQQTKSGIQQAIDGFVALTGPVIITMGAAYTY